SPEDQVLCGIIRAREPRRTASVLPHLRPAPGLVSRLARTWNSIETPRQPSGLGIEGIDVAAMRAVTAGAANNHLVFDNERSPVDVAPALLDVIDFYIPDLFAGLSVDRHQVIVHGAEENQSISNSDASIKFAVRGYEIARELVVVGPKPLPCLCIQSEYAVLAGDQVHDSVDYDRSCVKSAFDLSGLKSPNGNQVLHIVCPDLIERAVAPGIVSTEISRPVLRLFARVHQAVAGQVAVSILRARSSAERKGSEDGADSYNAGCRRVIFRIDHGK